MIRSFKIVTTEKVLENWWEKFWEESLEATRQKPSIKTFK